MGYIFSISGWFLSLSQISDYHHLKLIGKDSLSLTVHTKLIAVEFFAKGLLGASAVQKLLTFFWGKNALDFAYNTFEIIMSFKWMDKKKFAV